MEPIKLQYREYTVQLDIGKAPFCHLEDLLSNWPNTEKVPEMYLDIPVEAYVFLEQGQSDATKIDAIFQEQQLTYYRKILPSGNSLCWLMPKEIANGVYLGVFQRGRKDD